MNRIIGLLCLAIFVYGVNASARCRNGSCGVVQRRFNPNVQQQNFFNNGSAFNNGAFNQLDNFGQFNQFNNGFNQNQFGNGFNQFNQSGVGFNQFNQGNNFNTGFNGQLDNGFGVSAANGIVDPTQGAGGFTGAGATGQINQGVGATGGFNSSGLHNRTGGGVRIQNGVWVENINSPDPVVRIADGRQLIVDPFTGQRINGFRGMLIVDSGQVIDGQRAFIPASQQSVATILQSYQQTEQQGRMDPVRADILGNYRRFAPQFVNGGAGGFGQAGVGSTQNPGVSQNPGGFSTPPTVNNSGNHGVDSNVQPTQQHPQDNQPTGQDTQWSKWKNRYESAQYTDWKENQDKFIEALAKDAKLSDNGKYSAKVIRQSCASKENPTLVKDMTLFAFTSKKGRITQTHLVSKAGHVDQSGEAEAIKEAWTMAKTQVGDEDLGAAKPREGSLALVSAFEGSKELKGKFPGYSEVQLRVRSEIGKDGKTNFLVNQVIKSDADKKEKRWESSPKDKNLFCVEVGSTPPEKPRLDDQKKPTQNPTTSKPSAAALQSSWGKCKRCHDNTDTYRFKIVDDGGTLKAELSGGLTPQNIVESVEGNFVKNGKKMRRMPDSQIPGNQLTSDETQAIKEWASK